LSEKDAKKYGEFMIYFLQYICVIVIPYYSCILERVMIFISW